MSHSEELSYRDEFLLRYTFYRSVEFRGFNFSEKFNEFKNLSVEFRDKEYERLMKTIKQEIYNNKQNIENIYKKIYGKNIELPEESSDVN